MEHGQAKKLFPVIKNQTTYSSLIPLDQYLLWKETKETSWEDGKRKLVGLGWEGGRLGDGITELKTKYLGEGLPDKLLARYEMRHRDIFNCHLPGVDKDKVSESQLRMWVRGLGRNIWLYQPRNLRSLFSLCRLNRWGPVLL